jgi:YD repeat-containing protein
MTRTLLSPRTLLSLLSYLALILISCQKEISSETEQTNTDTGNNSNTGTNFIRIQQGTNPDISKDTVWLISYTSTKKISKIIDSLYSDTTIALYDASDKLIGAKNNYGDNVSYDYDAAGLLTQISYYWAGSKERYTFEYTNGVLSKSVYLSDLGSGGAYSIQGYETFTVKDGNITGVNQFSSAGNLIGQATFNYGTQLNPFKSLSLFNYANNLGMDQVVNFFTYFNKNINTGTNIGAVTFKTNNTFSNQRITKITSDYFYGNGVFTWMFSY